MAASHLNRSLLPAWVAAVALALGSTAFAQSGLPPGNSEQPINLEAASSDFDYKNNSLLFKRVKITQGGLEVTAQQASVRRVVLERGQTNATNPELDWDPRVQVKVLSFQSLTVCGPLSRWRIATSRSIGC